MDDFWPHDLMRRCIDRNDASTHYTWQANLHNAYMHQETRRIIKLMMAQQSIASERQLAIICNMSQTTLNRFMKGDTDSLDFVNLQTIAHYFGLTVSQLIGETAFEDDAKVRAVTLAMQQMPEWKKDALVAASSSLAEQEQLHRASGGGTNQ